MNITVIEKKGERYGEILTSGAKDFLCKLHKKFNLRRLDLLDKREERQRELNNGKLPNFLEETKWIREGDWKCGSIPKDLLDRRVEITGPVDRKMIINALNSGAKVFMADFEDSSSPTWENMMDGQVNLMDAVNRNIEFINKNGKHYKLNDKIATLMVRPRGWHLNEEHFIVDGEVMSASLFDFGLYFIIMLLNY